jgi:hypothetical protein
MADKTKKISANDKTEVLSTLLSNMPPPSQIPPRFFVPEAQQQQQQHFVPNNSMPGHNQQN